MRRSQSSTKEISRAWKDDIEDFVSKPLESLSPFARLMKSLNLPNRVMKRRVKQKTAIVEADSDQEDPKDCQNPESLYWRQFLNADQFGVAIGAIENPRKPFFDPQIIREFAERLGGDSLECSQHIHDIRYLSNQKVLEHYNKIYTRHQTIPIVFLSVVKTDENKIKAIYLWQFNEYCPMSQQKMEINCRPNKQILVPHNSMLLLGKFVTSGEEELLDGQFLSDSRVLIKSRLSGGSHLRFREYDMMDLRELVKVNPYETKVENQFYCASKLDLFLDEESGINCELSRIRRLGEIELFEYHNLAHKNEGVERLPMFIKTDRQKMSMKENIRDSELFSEVYSTGIVGYTVLIDRGLAKMISFKKDSLKIVDLSVVGQICSIYQNNNDVFYFLNNEGKVFRIGEDFHCEDLEIHINIPSDTKFMNIGNIDYLVYLDGTKFYSVVLQKGESSQYLFDTEQIGSDEEKEFNGKFLWEVVQNHIVFIQGNFLHCFDITSNKLHKSELRSLGFFYFHDRTIEWQFLSKNNKLFAILRVQNLFQIKAFELKEEKVQGTELESTLKIGALDWTGHIRKGEEDLFVQVTGPNDSIIFLRAKDTYLKDDFHRVIDTPNYLFSSFIFPAKPRKTGMAYWEEQNRIRELKKKQEKQEEYEKKLADEDVELEEFEEMKMRVNRHLKDAKGAKDPEKHNEERKEKMANLRKAIVRSGQEEGGDRIDKRLKDVKEEYMSMYQDLKKEKKQQIKEKEKDKKKDRKIERNNKRGEYD